MLSFVCVGFLLVILGFWGCLVVGFLGGYGFGVLSSRGTGCLSLVFWNFIVSVFEVLGIGYYGSIGYWIFRCCVFGVLDCLGFWLLQF